MKFSFNEIKIKRDEMQVIWRDNLYIFDNENHLTFTLTAINIKTFDLWYIYIKHLEKQNVARLENIFIEINLFKSLTLENVYIFYIRSNLYLLFHKKHLILNKYVNELFHFDIFDFISSVDIRSNYRIMFEFMKNVNKKSYVHFDAHKNKAFNVFKSFKINVKYDDFIIKRIYNDENIVIKDQIFNNFKYDHEIGWKFIISENSQMNEIFECLNQTLMIKVYVLLIDNELSKFIISELIAIINYFRNRSFIVNINKISYESEFDYKLDLFHLRRIE